MKCSYITATLDASLAAQSAIATPSPSSRASDTGHSELAKQGPISFSTLPTLAIDAVNMDHIELFHHYNTVTYRSFTDNDTFALNYRETCMAHGFRFPFLMHAILGLSAMHLSSLRRDQASRYRSLASSLQAVGLTGLNNTLLDINTETCVPIFIFSTMTGLHSFYETFAFRDDTFNQFLDKFVSSIKLLRGVKLVIGDRWEHMRTTELAELLDSGQVLRSPPISPEVETKPLREMLAMSDLGQSSFKIYDQAIGKLQQVFNAEHQIQHSKGSINMIFAWPIMICSGYNDLLMQRRPEAMIILAYYGVVLHNRRDTWPVGDAGQYLISSISEHLGNHWERWMAWPKTMITSTPSVSRIHSPL